MRWCAVLAAAAVALLGCTTEDDHGGVAGGRDAHSEATLAPAAGLSEPDSAGADSSATDARDEAGGGLVGDDASGSEEDAAASSGTTSGSGVSAPAAEQSSPDAVTHSAGDGSQAPARCRYPHVPESKWASDPINSYQVAEAPALPFEGVVQLWPGGDWEPYWFVRYLPVGLDADGCLSLGQVVQVPLPGEWAIDCIGKIEMVHHSGEGVEIGGIPGVSDGSFFVPWGGEPMWSAAPSAALIDAAQNEASNVAFSAEGDVLVLESGTQRETYEIRSPPWPQSPGWNIRVRHDGPLVQVSAQPAHLECFSGVLWLSDAATGQLLACGGNTRATAYVSVSGDRPAILSLPNPRAFHDYITCGLRLDLSSLSERTRYGS